MISAVVQILVAVQSAPALFAIALPGLGAGPVYAARMARALITAPALPPLTTQTLPGRIAVSVGLAAAGRTDGVRAVFASPSMEALAGPFFVASIVAKGVVPRAAVGGTRVAVVELAAHDMVGEVKFTFVAVVDILRPLLPDSEGAACGQAGDQVVLVFCRFRLSRLGLECFHDEREGAGPFEMEGNNDQGISRDRANAIDVCEVGAIGARRLGVDDVLRVFQANTKEDVAVGRGANVPQTAEGVYSHLENA